MITFRRQIAWEADVRVFGQEVRVVYNGKSALEYAGSFLPEIILLDLEMTGMDGYEVAMRLRELLSAPRL